MTKKTLSGSGQRKRIEYTDAAETLEELKETAEYIGRKPTDCVREAVRDWIAKNRAIYGMSLLFLLFLLVPGSAFAQFTVDDADISKRLFLDPIFPELTGAGGTSPLAAAMGVFLSAVLVVAGIILFYVMVAGTMSTAHDGQVLGAKWSSLWVPIRTALGATAIFPSLGGFCFIQAVVVWLALFGVGVANKMLEGFADNSMAGVTFVPPSEVRQVEKLASDLFRINLCGVLALEEAKRIDFGAIASTGVKPWTYKRTTLDSKSYWGWQMDVDFGFGCGTVLINKPVKSEFATTPDTSTVSRSLVDPYALSVAVFPTHQAALTTLDAKAHALAVKFAAGDFHDDDNVVLQEALNSQLRAGAAEYIASIQAAGREHGKALQSENFTKAIKQDGWAMLGAFYVKLAHAWDSMGTAMSRTATVRYQSNFPDVMHTARLKWAEGSVAVSNINRPGAASIGAPRKGDAVMEMLLDAMMEGARDVQPDGMSGHPLVASKNVGESMKTWGIGAYTAATITVAAGGVLAGNLAGKGLGGDTAFLGVLELVTAPFFALVGPLILMGAILSAVLPMIPFILWVGVILGWLILVVEAVIASPLWAVAHLAPDGDGVVGRGGQGYMLVLSLTLRPGLMVFGFICAVALLYPVGEFLNSTFADVFRMSVMQDNPSWGGLINVIMGLFIYSALMLTVMYRVFSLIHIIPDSVLRWIGGGSDNMLGQQAQPLQAAVEGQSTNVLGAAIGAGAIGQNIGNKVSQISKENTARAQQEESFRTKQDIAAVDNLDQSRKQAWDANEAMELNPTDAGKERAIHANVERGDRALNMAGVMDEGFAKRMSQAKMADIEAGGGTKNLDALIAKEKNGDAPYQRNVREAFESYEYARKLREE